MAKFICDHQEYLVHLPYVIRNSKNWTLSDYQKNLYRYINPLRPINVFNRDEATDKNYIDILTDAYSLCRKDEDINILRGILAENIFAFVCKKSYIRNWKFESGCAVKINNREVVYLDEETGDTKKTVDFGGWSFFEQSGIFAEVKVSPNVFNLKDSGYLSNLMNELQKYASIKYKVCIFSLEQKKLMAEKIKSIGYPIENHTVILDPGGLFAEKFFTF